MSFSMPSVPPLGNCLLWRFLRQCGGRGVRGGGAAATGAPLTDVLLACVSISESHQTPNSHLPHSDQGSHLERSGVLSRRLLKHSGGR